jgi:hypothetical protein
MTQEDIKSKLDLLLENVRAYRNSKYFKDLLNFCANFKTLAPYNAMLVRFQKPGARYVLTASEWKNRYDRGIMPNAQPLVVLFPFGPVNFVFEIQDTIPLHPDKVHKTSEQILADLEAPFKTRGKIERRYLSRLIDNLAYHGIAFDFNFASAAGYGAKIQTIELDIPVHININYQRPPFKWKADFLLSVNKRHTDEELFASLAHELGHFFCGHLPAPKDWIKKRGRGNAPAWPLRKISKEAEEFEAESVAWLICERVNIQNPSERYLSGYVNEYEDIPEGVSLEHIFSAFNQIWEMCTGDIHVQSGYLYSYNKNFQTIAKQLIERYKR